MAVNDQSRITPAIRVIATDSQAIYRRFGTALPRLIRESHLTCCWRPRRCERTQSGLSFSKLASRTSGKANCSQRRLSLSVWLRRYGCR